MSFIVNLGIYQVTGIATAVLGAVVATFSGPNNPAPASDGLQVIFEDDEPEVDIVCVHGLGGDPLETWKSEDEPKAPNWTREFLPGLLKDDNGRSRQYRVLTYGYSTDLFAPSRNFSKSADSTLFNYLPQALNLHSLRLIQQLADFRTASERRPLIFISHSLGGLIVKGALIHSSVDVSERDPRLKAIQLLTIGVLFFGTPHKKMQRWRWGNLLLKLFTSAGLTSLDHVLSPVEDGPRQADPLNLQIEQYKSIEVNFPNFSFFEAAVEGQKKKKCHRVVDADMAIPVATKDSTWEPIAIPKLHQNLPKFDSMEEDGFLKVADCIDRCLGTENYENAINRYRIFFSNRNCPEPNAADPFHGQENSSDDFANELPKVLPSSKHPTSRVLRDLLHKFELSNGLCHLSTLAIVQKIASIEFEAQQYEKAEALYKRLFVSMEARTPCCAKTVVLLKNMAAVALKQGRLVEATKTLTRARTVQRLLGLKEDNLEVLGVSRKIACLYESRNLYDDALKEYKAMINILCSIDRPLGGIIDPMGDKLPGVGDWWNTSEAAKEKRHLLTNQSKLVDRWLGRLSEGRNVDMHEVFEI